MVQPLHEGIHLRILKSPALPTVLTAVSLVGLVAVAICEEQSVSDQEAQEAIYEKYGECLAGTPYAVGRAAVEYADEVATVTPTAIPRDVLVFDMPRGISGKPLARPNEATDTFLAGIDCETAKPFWVN